MIGSTRADYLRCDFRRECYTDLTRDSREAANAALSTLLIRQVVHLKTRLASLLMETGVSYDRQHIGQRRPVRVKFLCYEGTMQTACQEAVT